MKKGKKSHYSFPVMDEYYEKKKHMWDNDFYGLEKERKREEENLKWEKAWEDLRRLQ